MESHSLHASLRIWMQLYCTINPDPMSDYHANMLVVYRHMGCNLSAHWHIGKVNLSISASCQIVLICCSCWSGSFSAPRIGMYRDTTNNCIFKVSYHIMDDFRLHVLLLDGFWLCNYNGSLLDDGSDICLPTTSDAQQYLVNLAHFHFVNHLFTCPQLLTLENLENE